ncbi:hypothetical protein [Mycolicibacterium llatzerense]|uniref:hypothetical protein n=1 Tax=Mycolicibacterium llatzerense TaxID=280871 RepID=UPI0008DE88C4|nr:hypothetical protein [Mycolicibacterium llatzerense]
MDELDVLMVAAVRYPWGEVVTGRRHRYVYKVMADKGITSRAGCVDGFVGKSGTFYSRQDATAVAISARQVTSDHRGDLRSEDLWPLTAAEKSAWTDM